MTVDANSRATQPFWKLQKLLIALLGSIPLAIAIICGTAYAECNQPGQITCVPASALGPTINSALPFTYAQILTGTVPVYANLADESSGIPPIRTFDQGFVWVSLADDQPIYAYDRLWFQIQPDGYIRADQVALFDPSQFEGVSLSASPDRPIAWVVNRVRPSASPGAPPPSGSPRLERYTFLTIYDERKVGDWTWYRIGNSQWIEQRQVGIVTRSARPPHVGPNDKWIDVNLFEQTLAAYEGDRMVYATLVSSGLPWWPTPTGLFQVWAKATDSKMSGREGFADYYYLEDVPWTMYFDQSVALHGTYWHDRFGAPHSHGCVNLSPKDARWLFDWTFPAAGPGVWTLSKSDNPGTWVWVH